MRIIDRYIIKQVSLGYILLLLSFLFLYVIIDLSTQLQDLFKDKPPFFIIAKYYIFFLPQMFVWVSPFSFLLSSLYCIGILSKNNQIISLRTEGYSILALSKLFIFSAVFLSVVSLFVEDRLIPISFFDLKDVRGYKEGKIEESKIIEKFSYYSPEGYLIFANSFEVKDNILSNVNIFIQDGKGNISEEIVADKVRYINGEWIAENASMYMLSENRISLDLPEFMKEKKLFFSDTPSTFMKKARFNWQDLSLKEINQQVSKLYSWKSKKIINSLKVEFHRKIALSFSTLFMLLGALPFGLRIRKRRIGLSSLGLAFFIFFFYYLMFSLSTPLGKIEFFLPWIACWLPNIFFGISGITGMLSLS